jgi:hypothetical protein
MATLNDRIPDMQAFGEEAIRKLSRKYSRDFMKFRNNEKVTAGRAKVKRVFSVELCAARCLV